VQEVLGDPEPARDLGHGELLFGDHRHGLELELRRVNLAGTSHRCVSSCSEFTPLPDCPRFVGNFNEHGLRLCERDHYREVFHTPEIALHGDQTLLTVIENSLGDLVAAKKPFKTSTYKLEASDVSVVSDDGNQRVMPLSHHSCVVRDLNQHALEIVRLYSTPENAKAARAKVASLQEKRK